jgi:hypothetical protein
MAATLASLPGVPAHATTSFVCDGTYDGQTFTAVVIPDGATCVITNSVIEGNIRNEGASAPEMVQILDTSVGHNIHLRNVTGSVTIGSAGCRVDPHVANNLMVRNSNNVAICQMAIDNNLVLRNNTGRLMARTNLVCNNIRVVRNNVDGLRVIGNSQVIHLVIARNTIARVTRVEDNTELAGNPGGCRKMLRSIS